VGRRTLVGNAYFRLTEDDTAGVYRLVRTATPFPSARALRTTAAEVERVASTLPRGSGLLIDAREAPARNDQEFEEEFKLARRPILANFRRVAVLVRTAVGRLQVNRYAREDGVAAQAVFGEEADALAFLRRRARSPK
jgi:hypothetical protein